MDSLSMSPASPANVVLNIAELSYEIFKYCDVEVSMILLLCNKLLYSHKDDEVLWRLKVQREFGVVRFKPEHLTFFQQYSTMKGPLTWEKATRCGRHDQLRVIRRKTTLSYYDITHMAIEHDQADIIQYVEEQEKYVRPSEYFYPEMKIGPKVAVYYADKVFKSSDDDNYEGEYRHILGTLFVNKTLPEDFLQLVIKDDNYDAASWYLNEIRLITPATRDNLVY